MKLNPDQLSSMIAEVQRGFSCFRCPEPQTLSQWAAQNFYLSTESSYMQGTWEAYPYQTGIMDMMSNDEIREVWFPKSARVGATKMMLAAIGYFAEHKKRNQAIWQPVDDDADEFVKTELDPAIRDIPALQKIFPFYNKKSRYNTLRQKQFTGSMLHIRGGKSAKNYRRISVDVAYLDELEGFDQDVDREGDPVTLAAKRVEGAVFPKVIGTSTPKTDNQSIIMGRYNGAELTMRFHTPCPHCDHEQHLIFGDKDWPKGLKWVDKDHTTAAYLCESCSSLFTQSEFLTTWKRGRWIDSEEGIYLDESGDFSVFRELDGDKRVKAPLSVGVHIWTAYSPMTTWSQIVKEWFEAQKTPEKLKTFINTTKGETWVDQDIERADSRALFGRREHYASEVPAGVQQITMSVDTQDDRFEVQYDGWGFGEERFTLDYVRLFGDPSRQAIWDKLEQFVRRQFVREDGRIMEVRLCIQDHGGHYGDEVNAFSRHMGITKVIPARGSPYYGKPMVTMPRKKNKYGVYTLELGSDTAKDLLLQRMSISKAGPGYWHWPISESFDREYFNQLCNEERVSKYVQGQVREVWVSHGRRNEPWDCSYMGLCAIRLLQQHFGIRLKDAEPEAHAEDLEDERLSKPKKRAWINRNNEASWI